MVTWADVRRLALALPGATETESRGLARWWVDGRLFVWERPLRRSDLAALGDAAPEGPILGARVAHLLAKEALLADPSGCYFTTPHFDRTAIVLVRLLAIGVEELEEAVVEAWLARAPPSVAARYAAERWPEGSGAD